jgi:DNA-binding NarL/FixJ family response regulator
MQPESSREAAVRVLIADDHPVFRYGMAALLAADPRIDLVGEAGTGDRAVELDERLHPDVILMDLNMPGLSGIEATRRIMASAPNTAILIVTMSYDGDSLFMAMKAGARGYLLKGADGIETLRAVQSVSRGEAIFSPGVAQWLIDYFAAPRSVAFREPSAMNFPDLTQRECEVLDLLAGGYANATIAERLVLSPKTVRNIVSSIFRLPVVPKRSSAHARLAWGAFRKVTRDRAIAVGAGVRLRRRRRAADPLGQSEGG